MSAPERIWVDDDGYWFDIDPSETRPEYIRKDASDAAISAARAEGVLMERLLRLVLGMAQKGCEAPNAAYRWCERIDEAILAPETAEQYAEWAWKGPLSAIRAAAEAQP